MPSKLSAVVRDNVRAERARRGWTQDDLAERLGWQRASVGHLEQGRRYVSIDDLHALCHALDLPASRLLEGASKDERETLGF